MTETAALLTQISRAKRLAAAMTNDTEKNRFEVIVESLKANYCDHKAFSGNQFLRTLTAFI